MIPNLLSPENKWTTIPYKEMDTSTITEITGIPIDEAHEYLLETAEYEISQWARWFLRRGVPFASVRLPDGRWGMWKHKHEDGAFCCGSHA